MLSRHYYSCLFSACLIMIGSAAFAQLTSPTSYLTDSNGFIVKPGKAGEEVRGSIYWNDVWCSGQVTTQQGKQFDVARMRFNILMNRVEYELGGSTYEVNVPCQAFTLYTAGDDGTVKTTNFRNNFPPTEKQTIRSFYEVVYDGRAKILRHHKLRITEHPEPLSLVSIKRFGKVSALYLYHPVKQSVIRMNMRKSEVLAVFDDKKDILARFMSAQKIKKVLKESDLLAVCEYYDNN